MIHSAASAAQAPEHLVSILVPNTGAERMDAIAEQFEVVGRVVDGFEVYVPAERLAEALQLAPTARVLVANVREHDLAGVEQDGEGRIAGYHSFSDVQRILADYAAAYPEWVKLEQYGTSNDGMPLLVLKVSDNVHVDEDEPEIMITSATHGDELITVEVVLGLLEQLLGDKGQNPRLQAILEGTELFFIPVVNPEGFSTQSRYANGVDPNRNYPWPEKPAVVSVPCVQHLREFHSQRQIAGSIDFHAYGELIMFPWAYTYAAPPKPDHDRFQEVTASMSEANGYTAGQISKVIYVAKGSSADYYYWTKGTLALGLEVGRSKVPPASSIQRIVDENSESTWRFIEHFLN